MSQYGVNGNRTNGALKSGVLVIVGTCLYPDSGDIVIVPSQCLRLCPTTAKAPDTLVNDTEDCCYRKQQALCSQSHMQND